LVREIERAGGRQLEVLQVKEKFGGLRIHLNNANDAIRNASKPPNWDPCREEPSQS
jgi:hypothetical protein